MPGSASPASRRTCEGEVEIRQASELTEYATLSPEHVDYLRAQVAGGSKARLSQLLAQWDTASPDLQGCVTATHVAELLFR